MTEDLFELDCLTKRIEQLEAKMELLEKLADMSTHGIIDPFALVKHCNYPSEEFNEFWEAYPRKKDMKRAWQAWQKCRNRPAIEEILDAIKLQKRSDQWQKGIIPLPTTYINGERWDDED